MLDVTRSPRMWLVVCALSHAVLACSESGASAPPAPPREDASLPEDGGGDERCTTDADCPAPKACEPELRICVTPCSTRSCSPDRHCDARGKLCVAGCSSDQGCAAPTSRCDVHAHVCLACLDDIDCADGFVCNAGSCTAGCTEEQPCAHGFICCSGACVDPLSNATSCGACGVRCSAANGVANCELGRCVLSSCAQDEGGPSWEDCDRDVTNGCEVDVMSDPGHCGACDSRCATAHTDSRCDAGVCAISACNDGYASCDGDDANGCEANLATSMLHCGRCKAPCAKGTEACVAGRCVPAACPQGTSDCDGDGTCETIIATDVASCGGCGIACAVRRNTPACANGTCTVGTCSGTFADCNGDPGDGCEVNLAEADHCGACDAPCKKGRPCGTALVASMATVPPGWVFNGSAFQDATSGGAILTLPVNFTTGTVIYDTKIRIDAFTVTFEFRMGFASNVGSDLGSDGMGFMLEQSGNTAIGNGAGALGMQGLTGFGVELDTFDNPACRDIGSNHISIDDLLATPPCDGEISQLISNSSLPFKLRNSGWHTATIDWNGGVVRVALDQIPIISTYAIRNWTPGDYYVGFAAATGFTGDLHEVRNIRMTFPTPRCL